MRFKNVADLEIDTWSTLIDALFYGIDLESAPVRDSAGMPEYGARSGGAFMAKSGDPPSKKSDIIVRNNRIKSAGDEPGAMIVNDGGGYVLELMTPPFL